MFCKILLVYCIAISIKSTVCIKPGTMKSLSTIEGLKKSMNFYSNTKIDKITVNKYIGCAELGKDDIQELKSSTTVINKVNAHNCHMIKKKLDLKSAVYKIKPPSVQKPFNVYCEMDSDHGWTVIQRRYNGKVDFYRTWAEYKLGFGNVWGEYWLGNDNIHYLTKGNNYRLKIDMQDWNNTWYYAEYDQFNISDEGSGYKLHISGYKGDASGDSLFYHKGMKFSTKDKKNDNDKELVGNSCAIRYLGAWWYNACLHSNLNGQYYKLDDIQKSLGTGINWWALKSNFRYSLKQVAMKIRPN